MAQVAGSSMRSLPLVDQHLAQQIQRLLGPLVIRMLSGLTAMPWGSGSGRR